MQSVELKLKQASAVLGVPPKELQNLVQFGVLRPKRRARLLLRRKPFVAGQGRELLEGIAGYLYAIPRTVYESAVAMFRQGSEQA